MREKRAKSRIRPLPSTTMEHPDAELLDSILVLLTQRLVGNDKPFADSTCTYPEIVQLLSQSERLKLKVG